MHTQRTYDPHRDLLELRGLERPACSNTLVPRGSHHISSLWSPAGVTAATGENRADVASRKEAKCNASVATGCVQRYKVRNAMKKGLPSDTLQLVDWELSRGGPLRCCTPVWISAASVSTSICLTVRERPSKLVPHRRMPTACSA